MPCLSGRLARGHRGEWLGEVHVVRPVIPLTPAGAHSAARAEGQAGGDGTGTAPLPATILGRIGLGRMKQEFVPRVFALVVVPLITAACTTSASTREASSTLGAEKDFDIVAYQGEAVLGGNHTKFSKVFDQGKPVVLNFWAGLCPPCRAEMPAFQKVADEFEGKVILLGVDVGPFVGLGSNDDGRQLLADLRIRYPAAYAVDGSPVRLHSVRNMPTTIFFAADGRVVQRHAGIMLESQLRSTLQSLVGTT